MIDLKKVLNLKKIVYLPYYYVPRCPECGSPVTGRYVKRHKFEKDNSDVVDMSLRNGEIVDFLPEVINKTAFCLSCGYKWNADIQCRFLSVARIEEEKEKRGTNELLDMKQKADIEARKSKKKIFGK